MNRHSGNKLPRPIYNYVEKTKELLISNYKISKYFILLRSIIFKIELEPTVHHHCQRDWFSKSNKIHNSTFGVRCSQLITLSFLFVILSFLSCEQKTKPAVTNTSYGQNLPTQESWNSRITLSQDGKLIAIIKSGHIAVYEVRRETILSEGVDVEFYNDSGERTSFLTSKGGKVFDSTRDLEATENVVVVSDSSGTTLRTQKLAWTNTTKKIHSEEYVEIDAPNEKIRGHGFESDQNLQNYRIFRVTGQVENIK